MNYTEEEINLITLSSLTELTYKERYTALSSMMSAVPQLEACENLLIKRCGNGVYNRVKEKYADSAFRQNTLSELEKRGIECVTYLSRDYPDSLKNIYSPPVTLFIKGRRELLRDRHFAIVGSRRSTLYSVTEGKKFAKEISQGFTVVTGSAAGADSAAIMGAEYKVISVIAFGFDHLKSVPDHQLIQRVENEGLLVSEHYPTVAPQPYLFPVRNRIIAGLSEGTLVVSAGTKSGALITANYATEYGRDVFAFPYNMGVTSGEGCNNLIKDGAILCRNPQDILSFYGFSAPENQKTELTGEEKKVLEVLREEGEMFLPALSQRLDIPAYKVIALLSALEIKGLIARLGGNRYTVL